MRTFLGKSYLSLQNQLFFTIILTVTICVCSTVGYGQLDSTFGTGGVTSTNLSGTDYPVASFLLPKTGKILVVARSDRAQGTFCYFLRYNSDGTLDTTYGSGGMVAVPVNISVYSAVRQPDGKIIVAGLSTSTPDGGIARVNEDGTLDTGFGNGGMHFPNINGQGSDGITAVLPLPDGKIMVAGFSGAPFGQPKLYLLRYLSNGIPDTTFGTNGIGYIVYNDTTLVYGQYYNSMFRQSNGKIVVASSDVRRFNPDGTQDNSFTTITIPIDRAFMQLDDKILLGSVVEKTRALERTNVDIRLDRYNPDGTPDLGFGTNGQTFLDATSFQNDRLGGLNVLPDGQILAAGYTYINVNRSTLRDANHSLIKLSPSGVVNGKYLPTKGDFGLSSNILVQPDGKIVVVASRSGIGQFSTDVVLTRSIDVPLVNYKLRAVPFAGFQSGQDRSAPLIFRPTDRTWYWNNVFPGVPYGLPGDIPVAADYLGQYFVADFAIWRPSNGLWYIVSENGSPSVSSLIVQLGTAGDIPVPADYDGDGKADIAVFNPSRGTWFLRNGQTGVIKKVVWGLGGDKPAPGDYDGDGVDDLAVFRPSNGYWYILRSSDNQPVFIQFGQNGDIPVQEDYDGDGITDIGVYRPGNGLWFRINSSTGTLGGMQWGLTGDIPVPADYDGDRKTDIAVWRPSEGRWYIFKSTTNQMDLYYWGINGDAPVQAKY